MALIIRKLLHSTPTVAVTLAGVLVLTAQAQAAGNSPPAVFVRVEGASATLLPQRLVQTGAAQTLRGHPCSAASAAGGLDRGTEGNWTATWSSGSGFADFFVHSIMGEAPAGNNFWTLWINGRSSSTGACSTPLSPGDHELWFDCVADPSFNCTNDPLSLTVASSLRLGRPVVAHISQLDGAGHSAPIGGAALAGPGVAAVSRSGGDARFVPHQAGVLRLQASRSGATPSDPVLICVYRRRPTECGPLRTGPAVHIRGLREGANLRTGPRTLRGTAGPDPAGITDVRLGLRRRAPNGRCSFFDAGAGSWSPLRCGRSAPSFSIGASASWSYFLPAALAPGAYRVAVLARDGNGTQTRPRIGSSVIDFTVSRRAAAGSAAAGPRVAMMVAGRHRTLLRARSITLHSGQLRVGHRRCAIPAGTALAGLLAAGLSVRVSDAAGCDPASMFVTRIGPDANRGAGGWEYKVGHADPSAGAADPAGRLRANQALLWYWCRRAGACQRTLSVSVSFLARSARVTVRGYDDTGRGQRIAGATVHYGSHSYETNARGVVDVAIVTGEHTMYATKPGLVRSFPTTVGATP